MSLDSPRKVPPPVRRETGGGFLRALVRASTNFRREDSHSIPPRLPTQSANPEGADAFDGQDTVPAVLMVEEQRLV